MSEDTRRAAARIAAPVAFLVVVTVAVLLVRSGLDTTAEEPSPPQQTVPAGPTTIVVRQGDTLVSIAAERGTTVAELRRLNPGVDPVQLRAGQRLRLR